MLIIPLHRALTRANFPWITLGLVLVNVFVFVALQGLFDELRQSAFTLIVIHAPPLLDYLDPLPELLGPYHLEQMRLRASLSTIIDANWKAVVDAFNEGYHVQGLHRQILPWTDDVTIEYEQLGRHAHYGRLPGARRRLRPSPRLHLDPEQYDEGEILASLVAGLGGAFLGEERAAIEALRAAGPPAGSICSSGVGRWGSQKRNLHPTPEI